MTNPVVLVHGLIGTLQTPDYAGRLNNEAISPDLLGYGSLNTVHRNDVNLQNQVLHLREQIVNAFGEESVSLVGHSVGGVVAALYANAYPQSVTRFISIEGNFTLKDAFWSSSIAQMSLDEVALIFKGFRDDPVAWLARSNITDHPELVPIASLWLNYQPASTIHAMAKSVVSVTTEQSYLQRLLSVFSTIKVHLVAGEHSRAGWDVPPWAFEKATGFEVMHGAGHMMMLEDQEGFCAILNRLLA